MIKYGRSIRWFNDYKDEVKFSKENNFDLMQIWYVKGDLALEKIEEPKVDYIKSLNYPVIIHALLSIEEIDVYIDDIIRILKELDHKKLIIHPIYPHDKLDENSIYLLKDKLNKAADLLKEDDIKLYVENNSKIDPINYTVDEIKVMYEDDKFELLLDLAHIDSYDHLRKIVSIKYPQMLHIADKKFSAEHEHLPIGEGELDFNLIFKDILKAFHGEIIFEVVDEDSKIVDSLEKIKEIIQ